MLPEDRRPQGGQAARARRLVRGLVYSLLPLIVLLVLLELGLAVAGIGDPDERLSLMRGFDAGARYLVPVAGKPGTFVTQMSDGRWPEVEIPPRGARVRVLLLGGSNTKGFPEAYLQAQLRRAVPAPGPGFEVINLGRPGYGSGRVRILLEQALELQPDIVFFYEGHNEFVERGFAAELLEQWKQPWIQRAATQLSRLRTVNVLISALQSVRTPDGGPPQTMRRQPREETTRRLTWEQTQVYYDQFRRNLEAMCRLALEAGAEVLMSTSIENMLEPPVGATPSAGLTPEQVARIRKLEGDARVLIPERFRAGWIQIGRDDSPIRLQPEDWGDTLPNEALVAQRLARGSHADPPLLRALLPPIDGGPYWSPPTDWRPSVDRLLATMAALHERALTADDAAALRQAAGLLESALAISAQEPTVLHTLAACLYLLGEDDARAVELFRQAGRCDRAPTHANDATNDIVREVAAEFPRVLLVDAVALFRARCPDGLVGYELLMDGCHLHAAVRRRLMDDFVPALLQLVERRRAR